MHQGSGKDNLELLDRPESKIMTEVDLLASLQWRCSIAIYSQEESL